LSRCRLSQPSWRFPSHVCGRLDGSTLRYYLSRLGNDNDKRGGEGGQSQPHAPAKSDRQAVRSSAVSWWSQDRAQASPCVRPRYLANKASGSIEIPLHASSLILFSRVAWCHLVPAWCCLFGCNSNKALMLMKDILLSSWRPAWSFQLHELRQPLGVAHSKTQEYARPGRWLILNQKRV
jgi:hypothetical protein